MIIRRLKWYFFIGFLPKPLGPKGEISREVAKCQEKFLAKPQGREGEFLAKPQGREGEFLA